MSKNLYLFDLTDSQLLEYRRLLGSPHSIERLYYVHAADREIARRGLDH